jgi:hypothetical protein
VIDQRLTSKPPLLTRVTGLVGLLLAGAFGLAAMCLLPLRGTAPVQRPAVGGLAAVRPLAGPATPASRTAQPEPAADDLVEFCSAHVTAERSFVLFSHGSCVILGEPSRDPVSEAVALLQACAEDDARFVPERTRDGGLIISFKEPVFHRFSRESLDAAGPWLDQVAATLLTPEESAAAGPNWQPPYHARVGLLARRRMLEDAAAPVAVRVIRAKQPATDR